jgi:hypothetical protein
MFFIFIYIPPHVSIADHGSRAIEGLNSDAAVVGSDPTEVMDVSVCR